MPITTGGEHDVTRCPHTDPYCPCQDGDCSWAWLAGIFEGEGCLSWNGPNGVRLEVKMTDGDVIDRLRAVAGLGKLGVVRTLPGHKTAYRWSVTNARDVLVVLDHIEPWLGERRLAKARAARERIAKMARMSPTCDRGHLLVGDNLKRRSDTGTRGCRACQAERDGQRDYKTERARR